VLVQVGKKAHKTLKYFTLCMPSNRPLMTAKASIETAIAFTGKVGGNLVVSDNSEDPEKEAYFKTVPEHVLYLPAPGLSGLDNLLNCLAQVKTEFILPMGDDDFIRADDRMSPFDFAALSQGVVGVKPYSEILIGENGIYDAGAFAIEEASPFERMRAYCDKSNGNNATYYSYYRSTYYAGLIRLIAEHHPTKGGYFDWALVLALMAMGRMAADPATIFTYNSGNWGKAANIEVTKRALFRSAGLPEGAENYEALFNFLDCCGFVSCSASPLSPDEKANGRNGAAVIYIRQFLDAVDERPQVYADQRSLIESLRKETLTEDTQPENMIPHALMILDAVKPGLGDTYASFLGFTMGC